MYETFPPSFPSSSSFCRFLVSFSKLGTPSLYAPPRPLTVLFCFLGPQFRPQFFPVLVILVRPFCFPFTAVVRCVSVILSLQVFRAKLFACYIFFQRFWRLGIHSLCLGLHSLCLGLHFLWTWPSFSLPWPSFFVDLTCLNRPLVCSGMFRDQVENSMLATFFVKVLIPFFVEV